MLNLLRPFISNVARRGSRSASSKMIEYKSPSIDDIPVPCGSWKANYDARQKVYNAQLIAGILALVGTITFVKVSGIIFFNFNPPEEPVEKK